MTGAESLQLVAVFVGVIGVNGVGFWRIAHNNGKNAQSIADRLKILEETAGKLEKKVNNGLADEVHDLQIQCAGKMSTVEKALEDHIKQPSHPGVEAKLADLNARVNSLEKSEGN
jgi:hypothetical protein